MVVMEDDGPQIDNDVFNFLPENTILIIRKQGEEWLPANSVGTMTVTKAVPGPTNVGRMPSQAIEQTAREILYFENPTLR